MSKSSVWVSLSVGLALGFAGGRLARPTELATGTAHAANVAAKAPAPGARPRAPISPTVYKVPVNDSPTAGAEDALVTLVEFSDYECPFCSRANGTVKQLQERYGRKLRVVMKHHPLANHPRARPAALAALAAGEQGKFWEMHEALFANPRALSEADLERYAMKVGLNISRWNQDRADPRLAERIRQDEALAMRLGATGTPAFYVNGRFISGAQPLEVFTGVVDEELRKAEALVRTGVRPTEVYARTISAGKDSPPMEQMMPEEPAIQQVDVGTAPTRGPANAPVTVVAFSDFECPFCARVVPTMKALEAAYPGKLRVAFKHQPLAQHANAQVAAEAAMEAHAQGRFWEFHDVLFANQRKLDRASLEDYARQVGLDVGRFNAALDSRKHDAHVSADVAQAMRVGATGTPTFFINGRPVTGARPVEHFRAIIDDELRKAAR
ncbi:thioredoxin domain-containing protein [Myxococcus xanthus]|uniref:DsbA family protein n=1 Tax=Myxococcus xanthus TaxID=34 RepID=UPI0019176B3F|nr:thioredoxin domain-containing protein [Myxococcus xanthus]QQR44403.1 thioredoxin domain-containing protein [Myxococcus xanthus]